MQNPNPADNIKDRCVEKFYYTGLHQEQITALWKKSSRRHSFAPISVGFIIGACPAALVGSVVVPMMVMPGVCRGLLLSSLVNG